MAKRHELSEEQIQQEIRKSLESALKTLKKGPVKLEHFQEFISQYGIDGYLEKQHPSQPCWSRGKVSKIPISRPSESRMVSYLTYSTPKGEKEAIKIIVYDLLIGGHINLGKLYFISYFLTKQRKYSKLAGTIGCLLYLYQNLLDTKVSKEEIDKMVLEKDYGKFLPELKKLFNSRENYKEVVKYFSKELGDFLFTRKEAQNIDFENLQFQKEQRLVRKPLIPQRKKGYDDKGHLPDATKPKLDLEVDSEILDHYNFWSEFIEKILPNFKEFLKKLPREEKESKDSSEGSSDNSSKSSPHKMKN